MAPRDEPIIEIQPEMGGQQQESFHLEERPQGDTNSNNALSPHGFFSMMRNGFHGSHRVSADQEGSNIAHNSFLQTFRSLFRSDGKLKWSSMHSFINPGRLYQSTASNRHRDGFGRIYTGNDEDRYLSAKDGRLNELIVQATDDVCNGLPNSTWARTKIRGAIPLILSVVIWVQGDELRGTVNVSLLKIWLRRLLTCFAIYLLVGLLPGIKCSSLAGI
jgi:hypothetical protein